jgi:3-polyprenyl-4-hydroxybenzoate decarboxylase
MNVVKGITVDLLIPAEAEIVIEGYIDTEWLEPEAPFGESHGHVNLQEYNAFMDVTAITRRKDAILTSIISQVTPSESSLIKQVSLEPLLLQGLREGLGIKCVKRVALHEPLTNLRKVVMLHIEKGTPRVEIWRAMYGLVSQHRAVGKYVIALDEDIDPQNMDAVWWALSYRCNPALDMECCSTATRATGRAHAQQRRGCLRAVRRDTEGAVPAGLPAQARIYGKCAQDLGGAGSAGAETAIALVRRIARRMGRALRRDGASARSKAITGSPATSSRSSAATISP